MAASEPRTFRHRVTGLVSEMEPGIAAVFADVLELIAPDTEEPAPVLAANDDAPAVEPAPTKKAK